MTDPKKEYKTAQLDDWLRAAQKSAPGGNVEALNWKTPDGISRQAFVHGRRHRQLALRQHLARL